MAKRVETRLIDDLDGSEAAESVQFGLDGVVFGIDLSEVHAKELRAVLDPYVAAGTKVTARSASRGRTAVVPSGQQRERNQAIRTWAVANRHQVAERGRIPQDIVAWFEAANR